ncbi:MAG: energy transducer TonB [Prevotella sp.]|nr:energy transducer TonB [Prevotella sp.]
MKRRLGIMLLAVMACVGAGAQSVFRHSVKYVEENRLFRNGGEVTVVRLDLEWPELLNGSRMVPLQQFLTEQLFGVQAESLAEGMAVWCGMLGQELHQMPSDDEVSARRYVECALQELWNDAGRYVSFYLFRQERTGEGKVIDTKHRYFSYDLVGNRVLNSQDIFRLERLRGSANELYRMTLEGQIANHATIDPGETESIDLTKQPKDVALIGGSILFDLGGSPANNNISFVGLNELSDVLSKSFRKYLSTPVAPQQLLESAPEYLCGSGEVLIDVDVKPVFEGGVAALTRFLSENIRYPDYELLDLKQGRVIVSFIVEPDGRVDNFSVTSPVSPGFDREAVRALRLMPRWTAGEAGGVKVRTRMAVPVNYKLE